MSLIDARRDLKEIVEGDFSDLVTVTNPAGFSVSINGLISRHHLGFDVEAGRKINASNAHCSFYEKTLNDAGYVTRVSGEVKMIGHKVTFFDSLSQQQKFRINEVYPDQTLGLLVCILGDTE